MPDIWPTLARRRPRVMLDGRVIGTCMPRHRHRDFLRSLKLIDQQTPKGLDLHLIVDNYTTHKTPAVKRWLKAHPHPVRRLHAFHLMIPSLPGYGFSGKPTAPGWNPPR